MCKLLKEALEKVNDTADEKIRLVTGQNLKGKVESVGDLSFEFTPNGKTGKVIIPFSAVLLVGELWLPSN